MHESQFAFAATSDLVGALQSLPLMSRRDRIVPVPCVLVGGDRGIEHIGIVAIRWIAWGTCAGVRGVMCAMGVCFFGVCLACLLGGGLGATGMGGFDLVSLLMCIFFL